jgi:hypothetical protein
MMNLSKEEKQILSAIIDTVGFSTDWLGSVEKELGITEHEHPLAAAYRSLIHKLWNLT